MDTEKQRQCRCDDTRLTKSGNARSEQLLVMPELLTNRIAARRVDRNVKGPFGFRYEISYLFQRVLLSKKTLLVCPFIHPSL